MVVVVVVVWCVWCGTLKTPCVHPKRLRVYIQHVSVCTGTTHTCVSTCARGVGIHRDVSSVHTEAFWLDTRRGRGRGQREGVIASSPATS